MPLVDSSDGEFTDYAGCPEAVSAIAADNQQIVIRIPNRLKARLERSGLGPVLEVLCSLILDVEPHLF